jgi:hypothetical protein
MGLRKTPDEQRKFLSRWVNLGDDVKAAKDFWSAFKDWFRPGAFEFSDYLFPLFDEGLSSGPAFIPSISSDSWPNGRHEALIGIRNLMRDAWKAGSVHERQWKLHPLRDKLNRLSASKEEDVDQPPPPNSADDAVVFLSSIAHKLKLCDNPNCEAEHYLIGKKKMPKFCHACANAKHSADKAGWWKKQKARINTERRREYRKAVKLQKSKGLSKTSR